MAGNIAECVGKPKRSTQDLSHCNVASFDPSEIKEKQDAERKHAFEENENVI